MTLLLFSLAVAGGSAAAAPASVINEGNAGMEALKRGDYGQAISHFTRVLNVRGLSKDDRELAYSERGQAYLQQGRYAEAVADLERAIHLTPDDQDAVKALEEARADLASGGGGTKTRMSRAQAEGDATTGSAALDRNDYASAERLFTRAIASGALPADETELAYLDLGKAYYQAGDNHRAVTDLVEALKLNRQDADAMDVLKQAFPKLRAANPDPPMTGPACAANSSTTGNFLKGKTYVVWAFYPNTTTIDALGGIYSALVRESWTVTGDDLVAGTMTATQVVPGYPTNNSIDVAADPMGSGTRLIITEKVGPLLLTMKIKENLCQMLQEAAQN